MLTEVIFLVEINLMNGLLSIYFIRGGVSMILRTGDGMKE